MIATESVALTRADRILVWLKILTLIVGGIGTLAVVFLADVMTAKLATPTGVAGIDEVAMSEAAELHHWLGRRAAIAGIDDKEVVYHVAKALALATDEKQKSALDGVMVEHMPAGHFVHTKNILKELLGTKPEPSFASPQLEAKLALALVKENKVSDAVLQLEHAIAITPDALKNGLQEALGALKNSDVASATGTLERLSGQN